MRQLDVYLVRLDPTIGTEINKTRPCVIISPDIIQNRLQRAIIAPLTSQSFAFPFRVPVSFDDVAGFVVLDNMRTVSKERLLKRLGRISDEEGFKILTTAAMIFQP